MPDSAHTVECNIYAGEAQARANALRIDYPLHIFSLSHVAMPFPVTRTLYGIAPDESENFNVHLGAGVSTADQP